MCFVMQFINNPPKKKWYMLVFVYPRWKNPEKQAFGQCSVDHCDLVPL